MNDHSLGVVEDMDEDRLTVDGRVLPIPDQPWLNLYYWQGARDVLDKILGKTFLSENDPRIGYHGKRMLEELNNWRDRGRYNIALIAKEMSDYNHAIAELVNVGWPEANFVQGQCYRKLADKSIEEEQSYAHQVALLDKAQGCFREVLDLLYDERDHPLYEPALMSINDIIDLITTLSRPKTTKRKEYQEQNCSMNNFNKKSKKIDNTEETMTPASPEPQHNMLSDEETTTPRYKSRHASRTDSGRTLSGGAGFQMLKNLVSRASFASSSKPIAHDSRFTSQPPDVNTWSQSEPETWSQEKAETWSQDKPETWSQDKAETWSQDKAETWSQHDTDIYSHTECETQLGDGGLESACDNLSDTHEAKHDLSGSRGSSFSSKTDTYTAYVTANGELLPPASPTTDYSDDVLVIVSEEETRDSIDIKEMDTDSATASQTDPDGSYADVGANYEDENANYEDENANYAGENASYAGEIANHVDTPADHVDTPADHVDTPADHVDTPADHVDTPADHVDTPANYVDTPADHVDTPADHVDTPADHVDTPADHVDTPADHVDTPADHVDTPANYADTEADILDDAEVASVQSEGEHSGENDQILGRFTVTLFEDAGSGWDEAGICHVSIEHEKSKLFFKVQKKESSEIGIKHAIDNNFELMQIPSTGGKVWIWRVGSVESVHMYQHAIGFESKEAADEFEKMFQDAKKTVEVESAQDGEFSESDEEAKPEDDMGLSLSESEESSDDPTEVIQSTPVVKEQVEATSPAAMVSDEPIKDERKNTDLEGTKVKIKAPKKAPNPKQISMKRHLAKSESDDKSSVSEQQLSENAESRQQERKGDELLPWEQEIKFLTDLSMPDATDLVEDMSITDTSILTESQPTGELSVVSATTSAIKSATTSVPSTEFTASQTCNMKTTEDVPISNMNFESRVDTSGFKSPFATPTFAAPNMASALSSSNFTFGHNSPNLAPGHSSANSAAGSISQNAMHGSSSYQLGQGFIPQNVSNSFNTPKFTSGFNASSGGSRQISQNVNPGLDSQNMTAQFCSPSFAPRFSSPLTAMGFTSPNMAPVSSPNMAGFGLANIASDVSYRFSSPHLAPNETSGYNSSSSYSGHDSTNTSPGFFSHSATLGVNSPNMAPGFTSPSLAPGFTSPNLAPGVTSPNLAPGFTSPNLATGFAVHNSASRFNSPNFVVRFGSHNMTGSGFGSSNFTPGISQSNALTNFNSSTGASGFNSMNAGGNLSNMASGFNSSNTNAGFKSSSVSTKVSALNSGFQSFQSGNFASKYTSTKSCIGSFSSVQGSCVTNSAQFTLKTSTAVVKNNFLNSKTFSRKSPGAFNPAAHGPVSPASSYRDHNDSSEDADLSDLNVSMEEEKDNTDYVTCDMIQEDMVDKTSAKRGQLNRQNSKNKMAIHMDDGADLMNVGHSRSFQNTSSKSAAAVSDNRRKKQEKQSKLSLSRKKDVINSARDKPAISTKVNSEKGQTIGESDLPHESSAKSVEEHQFLKPDQVPLRTSRAIKVKGKQEIDNKKKMKASKKKGNKCEPTANYAPSISKEKKRVSHSQAGR